MPAHKEMIRSSVATRGMEIIAISAVLYAILFMLVGLLLLDRIRSKCSLSLDAKLVLSAMLPTSFYFVATLLTNDDFHWNRHMGDIENTSLDQGFRMVLSAETMFVIALTLAKLSIMKLVRRIMSYASAFWRGLVIFVIGLVSIQGFVSFLLVLFQCGSPANFWTANRDACAGNSVNVLVSGILNIVTDFAVVFLTVPCILSFELSFKQKSMFLGLYFLGFTSIIAGILRTHYLSEAARQEDFTWAYYAVWMTSAFQIYPGIICATLPTTKHFFSLYFPNLFGPLWTIDHDLPSHKDQNMAGNISSGEEELLDFEKSIIDGGSAVTIATRGGTPGLSEEDREYIKITQQTVVQVSRVGAI